MRTNHTWEKRQETTPLKEGCVSQKGQKVGGETRRKGYRRALLSLDTLRRMFSWKPVVVNPTVQEKTPALVQVLILHPLRKRNPYIFGAVYMHIINCIFYLKL